MAGWNLYVIIIAEEVYNVQTILAVGLIFLEKCDIIKVSNTKGVYIKMQDYNFKKANFYATNSVPGGQKNPLVKKYARHKFRRMITRWHESPDGQATVRSHEINVNINPYAWPPCDPQIASWIEDDSKENYNLVSDPADMVIKWSTSYCADMIFHYTHTWLKSEHGERDANHWVTLLDKNGFAELYKAPVNGGKFVGILKDTNADGGHGLVVWFERWKNGLVQYSTYKDHRYTVSMMPAGRFHWIKICTLQDRGRE